MANPIYRVPSSLFIDSSSDKVTIEHDAVAGSNSSIGLSLLNNSAGASNAPQFSPVIEMTGAGYNTGGSASVTNKYALQVQSVSGSYAPTAQQGDGYLCFLNSYNGAAYSSVASLDSKGNLSINKYIVNTNMYNLTTLCPTVTWTAMSGFSNSYTSPASGWTTARYMKDARGMVWLQGSVTGGTNAATIFTLPAGFRPAVTFRCAAVVNDASGNIIINSSGAISAVAGGNTNVFFDNVCFMGEA